MRRHRNHSIALKRPVAQAFLDGKILHRPAEQHDISRGLIRLWARKDEAEEFDDEAAVAGLEARAGRNDPDGERAAVLAS